MILSLPFPHKHLWPNGRAHHMAKAREFAKHKGWAMAETWKHPRPAGLTAPIAVHLTIYPKSKGPLPDADNCVGANKAFLDGISAALKINDRDFAAPTVSFGPREGRVEITIGANTKGARE